MHSNNIPDFAVYTHSYSFNPRSLGGPFYIRLLNQSDRYNNPCNPTYVGSTGNRTRLYQTTAVPHDPTRHFVD